MNSPRGAAAASPKVDQQFDSHSGFSVKQEVYFEHATESWVRGTICEIKAVAKKSGFAEVCFGVVPILDASNVPTITAAVPVFPLREDQVHTIVSDTTSCDRVDGDGDVDDERVRLAGDTVNDLLDLSYLHDSTLLEQVRRRYFRKLIYTHIGPIMLALNPYDFTLKHYVDSNLPKYMAEGDAVVTKTSRNLPHAWTTAHYSYWLMSTDLENQSVIVSGESGAGKTETAKIVVRYLGKVSTSQCNEELRATAEQVTTRVNLTSPILEAFGNAKTRMNDNSSRFGKFMKVHFDAKVRGNGSVMIGAAIEVYLLEKSRIVTHGGGERSYHCFYQLLSKGGGGSEKDAALRTRISLGDADSVPSLSIGNATVIPGVDDAHDFLEVSTAMRSVGLDEDERTAVWDVVAGILHLLQINFDAVSDDECAVSSASSTAAHVEAVKRLFGINVEQLQAELTTTTNITRGEKIVKKLRKAMSVDLRDALAKSVYEALFLWLVAKINQLIGPPDEASSSSSRSWIGLLDIFGFENFAHGNSFEQMCINLANETLQNHYNSIIFTRDMNECAAEGINTASVTFYDNQPCLDLVCGVNFSQCGFAGGGPQITNKLSIMGLVDESCSLASGTDMALCATIVEKYGGRPSDGHGAHPNFSKPKTQNNAFNICHYAGEVKYTIDGFRAKNADTLKETLKDVVRESAIPFVQSLLSAPAASPTSSGPTAQKRATVGSFFKVQLVSLMTEINSTHPHWVRCIKPHSAKKPNMFHGAEVMTQLRSAGVLETVRIRQQSFSVRLAFVEFMQKFRNILRAQTKGAAQSIVHEVLVPAGGGSVLAWVSGSEVNHTEALQHASAVLSRLRPSNEENEVGTLSEACRDILRRAGILKDELAQVGATKVFLRTKAFHVLSQVLRIVKTSLLSSVHAYFQGYASARRVRCLQLNRHVVNIGAFVRCMPSQHIMRTREVRERERELLTRFRLLMILQRDEHQLREQLQCDFEGASQELECFNRAALVALRSEWERKKQLADAQDRSQLVEKETAQRGALTQSENANRSVLSQLFTLDWDDEQERLTIASEETQERTSCLGDAHLILLAHLHEHVLAQLRIRLHSVEVGETEAREIVMKHEASVFEALGPRVALSFQEAKARHLLLTREAEFISELPELMRKHLSSIKQAWEAHKHHRDRYEALVVQRQEQTVRLQMEDDWQQELILVLEDVNERERRAYQDQLEREAADERERLKVIIEERELVAQLEERQLQEMRRVAQQLWLQAKDEDDHKNALRRERDTISALRRQQASLTKQFMEDCRRRELLARPINSSRSSSQTTSVHAALITRAAEKIRQQLVLINADIAAHEEILAGLSATPSSPQPTSRQLGFVPKSSHRSSTGRSVSRSPTHNKHGDSSDLVDDDTAFHLSQLDGAAGTSRSGSPNVPKKSAARSHHNATHLRSLPVHCGGTMDMIERLSVVRCCAAISNYASNPDHRVVAKGDVELLPEWVDHDEQQRKLSRFHASKRRVQREHLEDVELGRVGRGGSVPSPGDALGFVGRMHSLEPLHSIAASPQQASSSPARPPGGPLSHVAAIRSVSAAASGLADEILADPCGGGDSSSRRGRNVRATAYCNPRVHCGISIQWPAKPKAQLMFPKVSKNPFSDAWRPIRNPVSSERGGGGGDNDMMYSYLPDGSLVGIPVRHWGAEEHVIDMDATDLNLGEAPTVVEMHNNHQDGGSSSPSPEQQHGTTRTNLDELL